MRAPAGGLQTLQIGQHGFAQPGEEVGVLLRVELARSDAVGMRAAILDIDDQQGGMSRIDRDFAARRVHWRTISA
jgi:hypothetical protein